MLVTRPSGGRTHDFSQSTEIFVVTRQRLAAAVQKGSSDGTRFISIFFGVVFLVESTALDGAATKIEQIYILLIPFPIVPLLCRSRRARQSRSEATCALSPPLPPLETCLSSTTLY